MQCIGRGEIKRRLILKQSIYKQTLFMSINGIIGTWLASTLGAERD